MRGHGRALRIADGRKITVKAKHYVLAGGGINSPALA